MTSMLDVLKPKIAQFPLHSCPGGKVTVDSNRSNNTSKSRGTRRGGNAPLIPLAWVTLQTYAASTGYTEGALYQKIRRGHYIEGKHFRKAPDGRIHMNVQECQNWGFSK